MFYRDGIEEQDDEDDTHLKLYRGILSLVPYFTATIKEFGNDFGSITELIDLVRRIPIPFFLLRTQIDGEGIPGLATTRHTQDEAKHTRVFCLQFTSHSGVTNPKG